MDTIIFWRGGKASHVWLLLCIVLSSDKNVKYTFNFNDSYYLVDLISPFPSFFFLLQFAYPEIIFF